MQGGGIMRGVRSGVPASRHWVIGLRASSRRVVFFLVLMLCRDAVSAIFNQNAPPFFNDNHGKKAQHCIILFDDHCGSSIVP